MPQQIRRVETQDLVIDGYNTLVDVLAFLEDHIPKVEGGSEPRQQLIKMAVGLAELRHGLTLLYPSSTAIKPVLTHYSELVEDLHTEEPP